MPLKTILVHLAPDKASQVRLQAGIDLARQFDAHLHGLFVAHVSATPAAVTGRGASAVVLAEARAVAREKAEEARASIGRACQGLSWTFEAANQEDEEEEGDLLVRRANLSDLAVVSQSQSEHLEDAIRGRLPDRLALEASCQTLVLPRKAERLASLRHLIIAWQNRREAGRAVRDALPFLTGAERVTVYSVQEEDHDTRRPADELADYLRRHGVVAEPLQERQDGDVGASILQAATRLQADAVVMGAYSRSRLREMILGGATRHLLGHMRVPTLLSH